MTRDPAWDAYEAAVMAGQADAPAPPESYQMSETFREWLVGRMRDEVFADGPIAVPFPVKGDATGAGPSRPPPSLEEDDQ